MTVGIVGLGLIGGSLARDLRASGFAERIVGVDHSAEHAAQALSLGLVDAVVPLAEAAQADVLVLAVPVGALVSLLSVVLDMAGPHTALTDVGSTKAAVCAVVAAHPRRGQFVAAHPMAGTENSGPAAALQGLFAGKVTILCESERSERWALERVEAMYTAVGARLSYLAPTEHDEHVAYVSHLSHAISYALAATVLDKEKSTAAIFDLASGGFASTARLAKSHAAMWTPIFLQNAAHLLPILDAYQAQLSQLRHLVASGDAEGVDSYIAEANRIRRVLGGQA